MPVAAIFSLGDQAHDIVRSVETEYFHSVSLSGGRDRLVRAHRHCVVAAENGIDVWMRLQDRFHYLQTHRAIKGGRLLRDHLQPRVSINHAVKTFRSIVRVVVAEQTEQLRVLPLFANLLDKVLAQGDAAGIAVGKYLRRGGIVGIDFAIDAKHRQVRGLCPAHIRYRAVRIRGVKQNGLVAAGNDVLKVSGFFVRIILRIKYRGAIPKLLGPLLCRVGQHHKPGIIERRYDDCDRRLFRTGLRGMRRISKGR